MPIIYCSNCGYTIYNTTPIYVIECPVCHKNLSESSEDKIHEITSTFSKKEKKLDEK